MLRRLRAFLVLGVWVVAAPAAAQEPTEARTPEPSSEPAPSAAEAPPAAAEATASGEVAPERTAGEEPTFKDPKAAANASVQAPESAETEKKPAAEPDSWKIFASGYFRAPFAVGISNRPGPTDPNGPTSMQLSYGPNRTVDSNYYSFAYTRLQEQDWVELFVHAKKKHVEAVVGWMGYWYQGAGVRNPDAAWVPGNAYLVLDTDFALAGLKPNIALTGGAFWPSFGYFEKYDTYTLARMRHIGEQLKLTVPVNPDITVSLTQGFGTSRDGSFIYQPEAIPAIYGAKVGLDLLHYEHLRFQYKKYVDVGLHFNGQWTRDPNLFISPTEGKSFDDAKEAHLTTIGGELAVSAPIAGRAWISPSYITVKNGWALAEAGTEVMHSLSPEGFATNYLAWSGSLPDSTGSGSVFSLGFLYENTLSGIQGKERGTMLPDVTLNVFGLLADARLDLPEGSVISQDRIGQMKYGADASVQLLKWFGVMLRWDEVNYDLDHPGYVFSALTSRLTFSSNFLSSESFYIQYSRYNYGDKMTLAGRWPWNLPLIAGSNFLQAGPYNNKKPDMDVIKFQASVSF
jgi:hypothetical protein